MYVTRPDARIHYAVAGSGDRDLVLLPPCYPIVSSRVWKHQLPTLARTFRVLTKDFRGSGRSDRPPQGYDFATHYADVTAVLEHARRPLAIAALACGAIVAIQYAVDHPADVSHLVLISPEYTQPLPADFDRRVAAPILRDYRGYLEGFWNAALPEPHSLKHVEDGIAWGLETDPAIVVEALRELGRHSVRDQLARVRTPTLVVHGTADRIVPYRVGREIAEAIPGARLNPELKRAPYVFITDFIGFLPLRDDPRSTEFTRAWEKNAEVVEHRRRHPGVRDLSLLVGDEEDVLDREFGPGLPNMRQWAREHFRFSGYTHHFDPAAFRDRAAVRAGLGFRPDERVVVVSVGGTRVGRHLLRRCAEAFALVAGRLPDTRMILVGGPRALEAELPHAPPLQARTFVPDLFRYHAAADLAIVQGGLTTTMELAALRTPFLYFPLRHHFEQQLHVTRRLERLGAGVRLDFDATTAEALGAAIVEHLGQPVHHADVPAGGTERAARLIADVA